MSEETARAILKEYKINNGDVEFGMDATMDDLIDVLEKNRVFVPCVYVLNKVDCLSLAELQVYDKLPHYVPISAKLG